MRKGDKVGDSTHIFNLSATDMNICTPKLEPSGKKYDANKNNFITVDGEKTMIDYSRN